MVNGPVSLFLGIETANWNLSKFAESAQFAKNHAIETLFVKVSEVGSPAGSYWYGGASVLKSWADTLLTQYNVNIVPYGFLYGDLYGNIQEEIQIAKDHLTLFHCYCMDLEGSTWSNAHAASWAQTIASALKDTQGTLYISCPADPAENNQLPFLQAISTRANVFMPMTYDTILASQYEEDYANITVHLEPTLDLSQEFGANDVLQIATTMLSHGIQRISLWEYQFAVQNITLVDQLVNLFKKEVPMSLRLNRNREVGNFINVTQFVGQHTEFACGPFAVAHVKYATDPSVNNTHTQQEIQNWAYAEYTKFIGADNISDTAGSSIANMYSFYADAGLHFWDLPINANSLQGQDIARIKGALNAGYPVIATVQESSVFDVALGRNPYFWGPSGNHIIVYTGIAPSGNLLAQDTANIIGSLTDNTAEPGPREYDASMLNNSYAAMIQTSWLVTIPSNDPLTWAAGFNAQKAVTPVVDNFNPFVVDLWNMSTEYFKALGQDLPERDTGIFNVLWRPTVNTSRFKGLVRSQEIKDFKGPDGKTYIIQCFTNDIAFWPTDGSKAFWLSEHTM